jgi:hypothetical protein
MSVFLETYTQSQPETTVIFLHTSVHNMQYAFVMSWNYSDHYSEEQKNNTSSDNSFEKILKIHI